MKIAIIAPPWIAIPPKGYGGIEAVVANLTEGLVKRGHEVLLFATGDSQTSARLAYTYPKALGNNLLLKNNPYNLLRHIHGFMKIVTQEQFDILHNHSQYQTMYFLDLISTPFVHTLHGSMYRKEKVVSGHIDDIRDTLNRFAHHAFVSISDNQRQAMPHLNYIRTVYNGIKTDEFYLGEGKGGYLAWIGRITPTKGLDTAIRVAQKTGLPLKIAAFIDVGDKEYFEKEIKPLLGKNTEFLGEIIDPREKAKFLADAIATLFPIRWHEPFGLVMVESIASGTPVIAFPFGSASEVIQDGKTGFLVQDEEEMAKAVSKVDKLDRGLIREYAIKKFNLDQMIEGYLQVYEEVIKQHKK